MSLRSRLLIALVALLLCGSVVADTATYLALRSFLLAQIDRKLLDATGAVARYEFEVGASGPQPFGGVVPGVFVQVRAPDGTVTLTTTGLPFEQAAPEPRLPDPLPTPPAPAWTPGAPPPPPPAAYLTVPATDASTAPYRVAVVHGPPGTSAGSIVTAISLAPLQETLQRLLLIEVVVTGVVVAASAGAGAWLVALGLRPLEDIAGTAAEIAGGDLSSRVERTDHRSEVGRLGLSLNAMLGQIEAAFAEAEASQQALRRSEERLRRFVADASHELRTPLAAVQAYAELFERGVDQHPEDLPRILRNIRTESERMALLVEDLLLLTRLDQGRPLEREPVDLAALATEAVEAALAVDPGRPLTLSAPGPVVVLGDRARLRQVLDNLLANARMHTPAGTPVEIVVSAGEPGARTTRSAGSDPATRAGRGLYARSQAEGAIEVRDHGPGLTDEQRARVFERFYRSDVARTRTEGGTGLGLSIVAAIAEAHGGRASAAPTPGGGATFRVGLPLPDQPWGGQATVPAPPTSPPEGPGSGPSG